ncbi:MAG: phosphatidylglycerophosphatase A [Deltaproteobacteria bacterium]|nr:phosphatidylglycerophosphatase A [Deltaproteobacteria bacterium]
MRESLEGGLTARFIVFVGSGAYLGYSPVIPGTVGTLGGILLVVVVFSRFSPAIYVLSLVTFFFMAIWVADRAEVLLHAHDSRKIVIDEITGFLCTMVMVPATPAYLATGFILFRILDVVKPYPANIINRKVRGGWGVVLDDVVAGAYANLILHAIRFFEG